MEEIQVYICNSRNCLVRATTWIDDDNNPRDGHLLLTTTSIQTTLADWDDVEVEIFTTVDGVEVNVPTVHLS